jgi:hypothetical protein
MWRDRKRKEYSGLYGVGGYTHTEGSTGYFTDNFGLEGLDSFNIGGLGRPPYFYPVCPHRLDYTVIYEYFVVQC